MSLSAEIATWIADLRADDVPADVQTNVSDRVLDTVAVAIAGHNSDAGHAANAIVARWAGGLAESTQMVTGLRLPAEAAALANGTYAHALDFDDTHLPSIVHPSAPLVPAALAQAEASQASRPETITALTAGYEVLCRLALAQYDSTLRNSVFFEHGFHATSILGTVAGAAACARLLGLKAEGIAHAIGIASSMGSGIIESNRTGGSIKKLHCGWAAHGAVTAAQLAANGLTGPPTVLEGRFGLFRAFCGHQWNPDAVTSGLGDHWCTTQIHFKPYPCNHFTHAIVDAALRFKEKGLRADEIAQVKIGTASASWRTIGDPIEEKRRPRSPYHAKFSAPFVFATTMIGGSGLGVSGSDFTDETLNDPRRLRLAAVCDVQPDAECDAIFPDAFPAFVTVTTADGQQMTETVTANRGGPERPLTQNELLAKAKLTAGDRAPSIAAACRRFDVPAILEATVHRNELTAELRTPLTFGSSHTPG